MTTVILGGGLSGLSTAYYLTKKLASNPITLIESSHRLGGWIKSNHSKDIIFEEGPRTIRPHGDAAPNTLSLIEDLGLSDAVIPINSSHPAAKNRMIFVKDQLHSLPSSIKGLFKTQMPFSKPLILQLMKDITTPRKVIEDESIYDFVNRRFGKEVADYLISAMICGICAGNSKEISVNFLMKTLFRYEQDYGSISKGLIWNFFKKIKKPEIGSLSMKARQEKWSVYSLENGLEMLPKALHDNIKNKVSIETSTKCTDIEIFPELNNVILHLQNGKNISGSHVISCIPSEQLGILLQKQHPVLSDLLLQIKSATVAVVNVHFDKKLISREGFGFLVPPGEKLPILGVTYDSCIFPRGENTVLTVMMGGAWFEELFGKNPEKDFLLKIALDQLKKTLNISEKPVQSNVSILEKCIPQYVVGHSEKIEKINNYINKNKLPLSLCGASYYGVGINDVILSSKNAVDRLLKI
ncbi:unnamed protein product [Phaedon cochleariae]|uniref:Protoporphyrinogen oxidase n=1 Tax=Phaedon cochleariae TaxID=80249 RepID=A0A9P0GWC2_PHACE|nr:unnamed protein product [Phaedon cochleariae]